MSGRPAARVTDPVSHPLPPILTGGPPATTVLIGFLPAWKGIPVAGGAALQAMSSGTQTTLTTAETTAKTAEAAAVTAAPTPGGPAAAAAATAARLAAETAKATAAAANSASIMAAAAGGASVHACVTPWPIPPHGPGVVIDGSPTVLIENMPATRQGDTIIEAIGPPNKIVMGCPTVLIGNSGGGGAPGAGGGAGAGGAAVAPPITDQQTIDQAIALIEASDFGKTEEGKKVLANIYKLNREGKISFKDFGGDGTRGEWTGSEINIDQNYNRDPESTASELVHEATHNLNEDENPAAKSKNTIDEEMRTNENQLDLYEEQRDRGYRDPELERRRRARANGTLRDDVRGRYPGIDEHL